MRRVTSVVVCAVLVASVYFGFGNWRDIFDTATIWQRLVGVTAGCYATVALFALYALWPRRRWLFASLVSWAGLVVFTATLATIVYAPNLWTNLITGLVTAAIVSPVVLFGWRRRREPVGAGG